jgi:hypothetical protein
VYLDDILIASPCQESPRRHVAEVLRILQENSLLINAGKCTFGVTSIEFLGHQVAATGIKPLADRVAAIKQFPWPLNIRELQAFLGLFNFYRRFVQGAARLLLPLTAALADSPTSTAPIKW